MSGPITAPKAVSVRYLGHISAGRAAGHPVMLYRGWERDSRWAMCLSAPGSMLHSPGWAGFWGTYVVWSVGGTTGERGGEADLITQCLVTQCGQGRVHWPGPTEPKLGSSVTMGWEHESGQSHFQHDVIWLVLKGPRISIYTMYYMYYTQSFCFDYLNSFLCFGALPLLSCLERGVALSSPRLNQKLDAGLGSGSMGRPRQWVVGGWGVGWGGSWGGDRKWTSVCC